MTKTAKFSPAERRNWGYWDGVSARTTGRLPVWNKSAVYRCQHPSDKAYGVGFWAGWYGETHPHYPSIFPGSPDFQAGGVMLKAA